MKRLEWLTALMTLFLVSTAWAGDSATIGMSCTIPSIPGLNAPPIVSEKVITDARIGEIAKLNTAATEGEQMIEKVNAQVKTIYAR